MSNKLSMLEVLVHDVLKTIFLIFQLKLAHDASVCKQPKRSLGGRGSLLYVAFLFPLKMAFSKVEMAVIRVILLLHACMSFTA